MKNSMKIPLTVFLKSSILCGLGFGVVSSMIIYYGLAYIVDFPVLLRDALVLQGYILFVVLLVMMALSVILWLPGKGIHVLWRKLGKETHPVILYSILFSSLNMLWILLSVWILVDRPFDFRTPWMFPALILFCLVGFVIGLLLLDLVQRIRRIFKHASQGKVTRIIVLSIFIPFVISGLTHMLVDLRSGGERITTVTPGLRETTDTKLVVIGLDGATFDIMDEMMKRGELPNIRYLMDNGSYGSLTSYVSMMKAFTNSASMGMRSPALWESIATGKHEKKHGIFDFAVMKLPLMKSDLPFRVPIFDEYFQIIPTTSTVGKSDHVWDILSRAGLDVGVLGWWNLWPVTQVDNGYVISDRIKWGVDGAVYPPDMLTAYPKDEYFSEKKSMRFFLNRWEGLDADSLITLIKTSSARSNYDNFKKHFKRDDFMAALSVYMLKNHPVRVFLTYFTGPDFVCHLFWKFMEQSSYSDVRNEDARLFGDIIYNYYAYLDDVIGKHVEVDSLDATYIIVSDHGFGRWEEEEESSLELSGRYYHPTYSGKHRQNGIIIMAGKNIKKGQILTDAHIFDITPTILALSGMPVALDMDGTVLVDAIEENFLRKHPLRYVNTYESGEKRVPVAVPSKLDNEIKERLRALGYLR